MADFNGEEFLAALQDDAPQATREHVCRVVGTALEASGRRLWVFGLAHDTPPREAIALVVQMGGELARGAVNLYDQKIWYAGAALVRQLVEFEYLMYLFATDRDEPARWLASSSDELRKVYQPAQMRRRSGNRFRDEEYWAHCTLGGHPNPKAQSLLPEHLPLLGSRRFMWVDLGQHLVQFWAFLEESLKLHDLQGLQQVQEDSERIYSAVEQWYQVDLCAARIPVSGFQSLSEAAHRLPAPQRLSEYLRNLE